jgi:dTDP-4-dehydrorhamnose reductase
LARQLEIWGGIECTLNRVGPHTWDQLTWNGHYQRLDDLDRIADLGIKTLRYPILWERWEGSSDWSWLDARMQRMQQLGIRPIAGLVHHGSGLPGAELTKPAFVTRLAAFAGRVAERYPWIQDYTPVNEPLTTGRFCALYGHWYPHERDDLSFARALVYQCLAIVKSMEAIRIHQPQARLLQTEDLGKTHSVPALRYQAEFENQRRWLSLDLLCGRVLLGHPFYRYLCRAGLQKELALLASRPCAPDLLGWNYYLTSERFLDTCLERHPNWTHGGNGRHSYADVEAVRAGERQGLSRLLDEAHQRFQRPMFLSEVHLGCTREEQLRWLDEIWRIATSLSLPLEAMTVWALLGSFEWNSLVTRRSGHYEPGAFDVRSQPPRETALAAWIRLRQGQTPTHELACLEDPGWWKSRPCLVGRPLLVMGAHTALGRAIMRACQRRGLPAVAYLGDWQGLRPCLSQIQPWAMVNAHQYECLELAEADRPGCEQAHVGLARTLGTLAAEHGLALLSFSSDQVFDGCSRRPYSESDPTGALSVFGQTLTRAEQALQELHPRTLLVRSSSVMDPHNQEDLLVRLLASLSTGETARACAGNVVSPTLTSQLVDVALDLLLDGESGLWHLANRGEVSWLELARQTARLARLPESRVQPATPEELGWKAPRPKYSALTSEKGDLLPDLDQALHAFLSEARAVGG